MSDYSTLKGTYPCFDYNDFVPGENKVFPDNRVQDFITAGPFVLKTDGSFEAEHMYERDKILLEDYLLPDGGEKNIAPVLGQRVKNNYYGAEYLYWKKGFIKWDALRFDDSDESACDPALFATEQRNAVYYAAFYVKCSKDERAVICCENSGSTLFVNGEEVSFDPFGRVKGVWNLGNLTPVNFRKGMNLVLFKVRPGYIADTMDIAIGNCSVFPAVIEKSDVILTSPTITRAYTGKIGGENQVFPVFAAAYKDSDAGEIIYEGKKISIPPMKKGSVSVLRFEIPAEKEENKTVSVTMNGKKANYYFPVTPYDGYEGREFVDTSFHFDTTYHQEQRTYALGAFHITKCFVEKLIKNPDFKATLSELDYLHPYYTLYPQHRDVLKKGFTEGRCEADCFYNQPNDLTSSGEAFIRNLIYGQLYHRDVMGRITGVYSPGDVFGHFSQMTQVCAKGGCNYIRWGKMMLGVDSLFRHVSPDGTVLIHDKGIGRRDAMRFDVHACDFSSGALSYMEAVPRDDDTSWMKDTVSKLSFAVCSDQADIINEDAARQLKPGNQNKIGYTSRDITQHHSGVLLTRTDFKQANRLCENLLITAEKFAAVAFLYGAEYPDKAIDKAARQILTAQHHDSITGTNNEISFIDLMIEYREAAKLLTDVIEKACAFIASGIKTDSREDAVYVFNPVSWERGGKCIFNVPEKYKNIKGAVLTDTKGKEYPAVIEGDRGWFIASSLPPMGYSLMKIKEADSEVIIKGSDTIIENSKFRLEVDPMRGGTIISLYDKKEKREVINKSAPTPANTIYVLKEVHNRMETQHELYTTGHKMMSSDYEAEVKSEKSALYQKLTVKLKLDTAAYLTEEIILYKNSDTVDFRTTVEDYQSEDDLFTAAFPVNIKGGAVIFDDRLSPHISTRSKKYMSFQTHQYASFSGCRVLPAGKWFGIGPSVNLNGLINFGMTAVIRKDSLSDISDRLLFSLTKKGIPVTPYPDTEQHGGNKIIHFNEDVYETDTRICLCIENDGNLYEQKLMTGAKASVRAKAEKALSKNGIACIYFKDNDNIYKKYIDVLLIKARDKKALESFMLNIEQQMNEGYKLNLDVIYADTPEKADDYGCAIINNGTVSSSVEGENTLNMMLFHTASFYGNMGKVTGDKELVPEDKTHVFTYSLYPHKASFREAEVYRKAEEKGSAPFGICDVKAGENEILPAEKAFLKTPSGFNLTAFKAKGFPYANFKLPEKTPLKRGLTLRGVETDGKAMKVNIKTGFDVFGAVGTDLLEENPVPLRTGKNSVTVNTTANSIETLIINPPATEKIGAASIDTVTEQVKKIYVRSWEHDMGAAVMGNLGFAATVEKLPRTYKDKETLYINAVNNFNSRDMSTDIYITCSEGIKADKDKIHVDIKAGEYEKIPLEVKLRDKNTEGQVKISYAYDGMEFYDVYEFGYFNPEVKLKIEEDKIICRVENTGSQYLSGGLYLASPFETWGDTVGADAMLGSILPETYDVELKPYEVKEYIFNCEMKKDVRASFWAAVKLAVNGRIHFAFDMKKGPRHNIWAHEFWSEIEKDKGSIKKILEM